MLQLRNKHQEIIQQILSKYPYKFYAYGSRVKGQAEECSDLDLCYQEKIPWKTISNIWGELEDSDLPFKVDLVYWEWMAPEFREIIRGDLILLN